MDHELCLIIYDPILKHGYANENGNLKLVDVFTKEDLEENNPYKILKSGRPGFEDDDVYKLKNLKNKEIVYLIVNETEYKERKFKFFSKANMLEIVDGKVLLYIK